MRTTVTVTVLGAALGLGSFAQTSKGATPAQSQSPKRTAVAVETPNPQVTSPRGGGFLGVDVTDVTAERLSALKLKQERGAEITAVDSDAPAGKAGLKQQDVILSYNGTAIESVEQLRRLLRETPPGRTVSLGVSRDGQPLNFKVQLGDRSQYLSQSIQIRVPPISIPQMEINVPAFGMLQYSRHSGLMVEDLTPQLGEYFGVKNGQGVLVRSVEMGSKAEAAGFKAGDVIIRAGSEQVNNIGDWRRLLRKNAGASILVAVIRQGRERSLQLALPEARDSGQIDIDMQELSAAMHAGIEQAKSELARLQPQIEKAQREAEEKVREALKRQREQLRMQMNKYQEQLQDELH